MEIRHRKMSYSLISKIPQNLVKSQYFTQKLKPKITLTSKPSISIPNYLTKQKYQIHIIKIQIWYSLIHTTSVNLQQLRILYKIIAPHFSNHPQNFHLCVHLLKSKVNIHVHFYYINIHNKSPNQIEK